MKTTETGKLKRCDKVRVNGRIGTVTGVHEPKWIDHRTRANMHVLQGAMIAFEDKTSGKSLFALTKGSWKQDEPVLVRVHSSCVTGDILGSLRCDCGPQLHAAMRQVNEEGKGVVLYIQQEGRGIGLMNKLKAYKLQEEGLDTVEANHKLGFKADQRDYGIGAQVLRKLEVSKLKLMTNNPKKRIGLIGYGLEIVDNVPLEIEANPHNENYLKTKRDKLGHNLFQSGLK